MSIADLGKLSVHRNPIISDIFFRAGLIEKIGSGIRRIRETIQTQGGKMPEFISTEKYFLITIWSLLSEKSPSEVQVNVSEEKSSVKIIQLISENNYITTKELSGQ